MEIKQSIFELISIKSENGYDSVNIQPNELIQKLYSKDRKAGPTRKEIGKSLHVRSQNKGIQIEYIHQCIQTVFVYFRTNKMNKFQGNLPFGINQNWTLKTSIFYLGEPAIKSKLAIETIYQNLGVGLVFKGHWSNDDSLIDYCYFFKQNGQILCSTCKIKLINDAKTGCKNCKFTRYCSKECLEKHKFQHRMLCHQIE